MDSCDAARAVFTRVQSIEPDHAHKIVGYILLQDQAEKEMIRLAFGPESHIHSVISQAKSHLRLSSPSPLSPASAPTDSPLWENGLDDGSHLHRRSSSVNDICLYFSRGFCKNGSACKFSHGEDFGDASKIDAFELYQQEILRSKAAQQQRLAASQFMSGVNFPFHKLSFLQREAQRSAGELNRFRTGRNEVCEMGFGESGPGARQIYLTFPADSTFKEEDVSNYFSIFGPVQDVRIPHQQKRMFGFVTFVYPETVRVILAKGNPHFVCDSRVLVKPYKEKGKLSDKKQHLDMSEFSSCSSPTGIDYREPFEMHVGPRMLSNNREMLRKKLEQEAAWQHALEFQRRRLMNLQLVDLKNHHFPGSPSQASANQNMHPTYNIFPENASEVFAENQGSPTAVCTRELLDEVNTSSDGSNANKEDNQEINGANLLESLEHILPDGLLASPTKSAAGDRSIFATKPAEVGNGVTISTSTTNNDSLMPPLAPTPKSQFDEIHSLSSGHGAIGI